MKIPMYLMSFALYAWIFWRFIDLVGWGFWLQQLAIALAARVLFEFGRRCRT